MEDINLHNLHFSELFNIAKSLDIKYIRKYSKAELIKGIIKAEEQLHKDRKSGKKNRLCLETLRNLEIFSFDDGLFAKSKRVKEIKCDICGKYIKNT